MPRVTLRDINSRLAVAGHAERLVRGTGYFYFAGGESHTWPTSSIAVGHLSAYTALEWVDRRNELAAAKENR